MIVNCCATCEHAQYSHKKGKTVHCLMTDETFHQLEEPCEVYARDVDKVERINNFILQLDKKNEG